MTDGHWVPRLREVLGDSEAANDVVRLLQAREPLGQPPARRNPELGREPDSVEIEELRRRMAYRALLQERSDAVLAVAAKLPADVLDLLGSFLRCFPTSNGWDLDFFWTGSSIVTRMEVAITVFDDSAERILAELFPASGVDDPQLARLHRRLGQSAHTTDREEFIAAYADHLRPALDPLHPCVLTAWSMVTRWAPNSVPGLFPVEISAGATCRLSRVRTLLRPFCLEVEQPVLAPLLLQQLELGNAATRTEALSLLIELTPSAEHAQLAGDVRQVVGHDRSKAVRTLLDRLATTPTATPIPTENNRASQPGDLDETISLELQLALPDHIVRLLDGTGRIGRMGGPPPKWTVFGEVGAAGAALLGAAPLARLVLAHNELRPDRRGELLDGLCEIDRTPSIRDLEAAIPQRAFNPRFATPVFRAVTNLSTDIDRPSPWTDDEIAAWIEANSSDFAALFRSRLRVVPVPELFSFAARHADLFPAWLTDHVFDAALDGPPSSRVERQRALGSTMTNRIVASLGDAKAERRAAAATWLAHLGVASVVGALRAATETEQHRRVVDALDAALATFEVDQLPDIATDIAELSELGTKRVPAAIAWLDVEALTPPRLDDGAALSRTTTVGWIIDAVRAKSTEPSKRTMRLAKVLDPHSADELGGELLAQWLAADQRSHDEEELATLVEKGRTVHGIQFDFHRDPVDVAAEILQKPAGTAMDAKGLLGLVAALGPATAARHVSDYVNYWTSGFRRSQCSVLIDMLGRIDHPEAIETVCLVAQSHPRQSVRKTATDAVRRRADRSCWTDAEVADRLAVRSGLSPDGVVLIDSPTTTYLAQLTPSLEIEIVDQRTGRVSKQLPRNDRGVLYDDRERLKVIRSEIKSSVTGETNRMNDERTAGRTYPVGHFINVVLTHPVLYRLASQHTWALDRSGSIEPIAIQPGAITDLAGSPVAWTAADRIRPGS